MKTLIIDNYDSFTFNLVQMAAALTHEEPLVLRNDQFTWTDFQNLDVDNVIISPGPGRPENERDLGVCNQIVRDSHLPVLGVCLGLQAIGYLHGGRIIHAPEPVHGQTSPIYHRNGGIFAGIPQGFHAVRYHSLTVGRPVPDCLEVSAWTDDELVMGLEHRKRPLWGVQFHPESVCTEFGEQLLANFNRLSSEIHPARTRTTTFPIPPIPQGSSGRKTFTRKLAIHLHPEQVFGGLFANECPAFWLDSPGAGPHGFSFMGAAAGHDGVWASYWSAQRRLEIHSSQGIEAREVSIFDFLQTELQQRACTAPELPFDFNGGFVGYMGYELKAECGGRSEHLSPYPDACLIFADRLLAFDHAAQVIYLVYAGREQEADAAELWFAETEGRLRREIQELPAAAPSEATCFSMEQSRDEYLDSIGDCLGFIRDGESYEICLTNRLTAKTGVDPFDYYRALRRFNPAPYSAFLRFPNLSVACSSPERFLKIDRQRIVESRPIKGTVRRGANSAEDQQLGEILRTSVKTRSENLMIVDLLRNDLGRVCEIGSVHVPQMMEVETYRNLHQLVSTVRGTIRPDASAVDCFRSAFPGGSMTGAPKVRTMELIDQLERSARGIYSGAIGFFALCGAADFNIVIRTAVFSENQVTIGVGGAIVALSDPETEFEETILKGQTLMDAFREGPKRV